MFLTTLELVADSQPDYWTVSRPLVWCDSVYGRIEVPAGTRTDLASIPRFLRNLPFLDPDGNSRRPAVAHDFLYDTAYGHRLGKQYADNFLRDALISEGASKSTAAAFYWAVHMFGGRPWSEFKNPV